MLVEIVKKCFLFHLEIGKGLDENIEWSVSILDTSEDGFQKLENELTNHLEGKEDHSKSESDSEFDNLFNGLRKVAYPNSDNPGKHNIFKNEKNGKKNLFLLKVS